MKKTSNNQLAGFKLLLIFHGLKTEQELYQYLFENYINGNKSDVKAIFADMPKEKKKECVKYVFALNDQEFNDTTEWFFDLL